MARQKIRDDKKFQVMPAPDSEDYERLKADILEHGIQEPVEIDADGYIRVYCQYSKRSEG